MSCILLKCAKAKAKAQKSVQICKSYNLQSISPTFYGQLFWTKVFCPAFMCLQIGFVIFWQNEMSTKAACKMLVKLTPKVSSKIDIANAAVKQNGAPCQPCIIWNNGLVMLTKERYKFAWYVKICVEISSTVACQFVLPIFITLC